MKLSHLVPAMLSAGALACGSSGGSSPAAQTDAGASQETGSPMPEAGPVEAATEAAAPVDHGSPSSTYPAFPPNFPQITDQGGSVMKSPVVVAITWTSDASEAMFDTFADGIGGTAYWKATTSEYGIGAAVSGTANHVHLSTTPPTQLQDSDIQTLVTTNAGITAGWPAPTANSVYAFFLPPGTSLQTQGLSGTPQDACTAGEGGYQDQVTVGSVTTSYAVVPSCTFGQGIPAAEQSTESMSHELVEAATDPHPSTPTYLGFDADHFSFNYFQELQAEVGDACEFYRTAFFEDKEATPATFDAWVQRTWSNASGAAGHDPCVPVAAGSVYFNVTPLGLESVNVTIPSIVNQFLPGLQPKTKGVVAAAGKTVTFPVGFYSDGPTGGPWQISVAAGNPVLASQSIIDQYNPSTVTATVDRTSGQNGEKAYVTVNVKSTGTLFAGEIVTVTSTLGGVSHYMPVWVAGQ